ncbi:MAG: GNAT family N-acetyltransferase [Actinomycetota bacterium]
MPSRVASFALRPASPDDAERITRSYFAAWCANLAYLFPDGVVAASDPLARLPVFEAWLAADSGFETTVAIDEGGAHLGHTTVRADELVHLFIDPGAQGRGVGHALLEHGESQIAARGANRARLFTLVGNDAAVAFYRSHGWEETEGRQPGEYFGQPMVEQLLVKSLQPATMGP